MTSKKSTLIWIILLALPIPLLFLALMLQGSTRNSPDDVRKIINIFTLLIGITAVPMLLGVPLWLIMLVRAIAHNKALPPASDTPVGAQYPYPQDLSQIAPTRQPSLYAKVVVVALVIFVVVALLFIMSGARQQIQDTGQSTSSEKEPANPAAADDNPDPLKIKEQQLNYSIPSSLLAYYVSAKTYPDPNKAAWDAFVSRVQTNRRDNGIDTENPFVDPYTKTTYVFTDASPEYGEIQYRFPASCDNESRQFINARPSENYAFRLKFPDGIRCYGNL